MPAIRASFSERENVMVMTCNFIHPPTLHSFPCIATTSPPRRSSRHKRRQVSIFAPLIWDACIMGYLFKEYRNKTVPAGGLAPLAPFPPPLLLSSLPHRLSRPSLPLPPLPLSLRNMSRSGISLFFVSFFSFSRFSLLLTVPAPSVIPPEGFDWRRCCFLIPKTSFSPLK